MENPFVRTKGIISKSAEYKRDRILSVEEEQRLLSVCIGRRIHIKPILICALDTGMRRKEMFTLKWRDVNFEKNEILIHMTNTKTEKERTVGITSRLRIELETLWENSPKDITGSVFGITDTIKTAFTSACLDANIKDFHLHDCRHTATTRMIASGSPHTEVMKITGHTQLKTFLRYLSITPETAKRCAMRLNDYLNENNIQSVASNLIN